MMVIQVVQTPKFVDIALPLPGSSLVCEVRDVQVSVDQTCSGVRHVNAAGTVVPWTKSNHIFPAFGNNGWKENWTCPTETTFLVEANGKVRIHFGGGRDASVYDAIIRETQP